MVMVMVMVETSVPLGLNPWLSLGFRRGVQVRVKVKVRVRF